MFAIVFFGSGFFLQKVGEKVKKGLQAGTHCTGSEGKDEGPFKNCDVGFSLFYCVLYSLHTFLY